MKFASFRVYRKFDIQVWSFWKRFIFNGNHVIPKVEEQRQIDKYIFVKVNNKRTNLNDLTIKNQNGPHASLDD